MFRFWASESRGSDKTVDASHPLPSPDCADSVQRAPVLPQKRRPSSVDTTAYLGDYLSAKRAKTEQNGGLPSPTSALADDDESAMLHKLSIAPDLERAKDVIQYQFGLEILLKHDELRLINQELAKCQVALEQLRRCHLIPYPVQCPTPSQMLEIHTGKGPALQSKPGHAVPKWAPPFGVVDGPYARHYAKWLIPDPVFDGFQPEPQGFAEAGRTKSLTAEGRTTRNSMSDGGANFGKPRPARGLTGHRLQALSSGYPQPKDKQAPCVLKRSDGVTVKLICIDCNRWDFSSTQGFINHCRIAHRRDFKSHEEAAVHCGHPIDLDDGGSVALDESKTPVPVTSTVVHPLARNESISDQQGYKALLSRINASLDLYHAGKLPNVRCIPRALAPTETSGFVGSSDTPYLSRLIQKKKLGGNLKDQVNDAKIKVDWDLLSPGEDSDDTDQTNPLDGVEIPKVFSAPAARTPAVMRIPARSAVPPPPSASIPLPQSSKGRVPTQLGLANLPDTVSSEQPETPPYDDDMDVDLSPNTAASNNAPSLVSDDGEYDDSDGSASDTSDDVETESVSDVAEINIEEDHDTREVTPRPIHRCRPPSSSEVKLRKDDNRHVTFVAAPIANGNAKARRKQKA
ncbi:hypothetical protein B0T26DRAFT_745348 [Lasiosphaeria miniovina]|uniref:AHC1-like C2H2 zinc-finger domain-containing protein n=1 Tax=Lasiosphaeria miniovina TaxID=1954250 RepID=A0AA40BFG9_9PEZI|nr:uncharacterized protein B0T26DRAFT_745348 [Lasiosphaeria miniovina]KAK0733288.1 hypothetical protein B0T26DRAFT_745348 [Lasiosphaeria miniovina]